MIKANKKHETGTLSLESADIERVAQYLTKAGDTESIQLRERKETISHDIETYREMIARREDDVREYRERIERSAGEVVAIEREIAELPQARVIPTSEVVADIERVRALPYVKSIRAENMDGLECLVVTTRENALYTTLNRKYSRAEHWYRAKPYKIPLPAYNIRIGLAPHKTCANDTNALALALADSIRDTAHFLPWISRFFQEVHPHWGTSSASRREGAYNEYKAICLGEYEGEVSSAFRKSIAEGVTALAVYLQTAGTANAYVHARERWALYLGKREYNTAIVPSESELKTLAPVSEEDEDSESDDDTDGLRYDENGDRDDEGAYDSNGNEI